VFIGREREASLSNHIVKYLQRTDMNRTVRAGGSFIIFIDLNSPLLIATMGVYSFLPDGSMINSVNFLLPMRLY